MTKENETDRLTAYAEVIGRIEYLINHYDDPDRALARIREIVSELHPQQTPPEPAVDSWPIIISNQVRKNPADSPAVCGTFPLTNPLGCGTIISD